VEKLFASYAAKVDSDPEPLVLVEPGIVDKPKPEAINEPEPEPEVVDEPESEPEVVELVPLQEDMSSRPKEVKKFPIETLINLAAEPTMKLVPSLVFIRTSLSLRLPDVYDPLQIFLHETVSQETGTLICGLDSNEAEMTYYVACMLLELPPTATDWSPKSVPPPLLWFSMMPQC